MKKDNQIIINQLQIMQMQRTTQDIESWRKAMQSAESITNPSRKLLYTLYHDIMLDGVVSSAIENKRLTHITNLPIRFMRNGEDVPEVSELAKSEEFDLIMREILNSKFWGYTLLELQFLPDMIIPSLIPREHVKPELGIVVISPSDTTGIAYTTEPYSRYCLTAGRPKDLGLLLKVAQYAIYKRGGFGDWGDFAEIFGMPFRKGTYEPYDENGRLELTRALEQVGSAAYIVIPKGTDIEFVTNNSMNATGDIYDKLRKACNEEINICLLGQTLTTSQGDKGARSLGDVHQSVEDQIHEDDRQYVLNTLNKRLLPLMKLHGYPVDGGEFIFPMQESVAIDKRLEMDIKIAGQVPVDDDYFYETYDIPKPANYDALKEERRLNNELARMMMQPAKAKDDNDDEDSPANRIKNWFSGFFQ